MAEIAFVIQVPNLPAAALGNFIAQSVVLEQDITQDLPVAVQVRTVQIGTTDNKFVLQTVDPGTFTQATTPSDRTSLRAIKKQNLTVVGAGAGAIAVAGITLKNTLISVVSIDDTTHAATDLTAGTTITAANQITTGGTSAGGHVVVTWI